MRAALKTAKRFLVEIVYPGTSIEDALNAGKKGYTFRQYVRIQQRDHGPYYEVTWEKIK